MVIIDYHISAIKNPSSDPFRGYEKYSKSDSVWERNLISLVIAKNGNK